MEDLININGSQLAERIKNQELNKEEVFSFFKSRIKKIDPALGSFVEDYDQPIKGEGGSTLSGLPIAIKIIFA